jgi:outer membrane protein assembly factor BamB
LSAYDSTSGHLVFTHALPGSPIALAATQNRLGIASIIPPATPTTQSSSAVLLIDDAQGTQTQQIALGALMPQQFLASNDTFFVGATTKASSTTAQFLAFDPMTGAQRWQHTIPNANNVDNFVVAGQDLIGNVETQQGPLLTAFNTATGAQVWQATTGTVGGAAGSIGAGGDAVYTVQSASANPPSLVATVAATGATRWNMPLPNLVSQVQIVAADQQAVYCDVTIAVNSTTTADRLVAFAASDGHQLWFISGIAPIDSEIHGQGVGVVQGILYVTATPQGTSSSPPSTLMAVKVSSGALLWSKPLSDIPLTAPAVSGNGVSVGLLPHTPSGTSTIVAFNITDGSSLWQTQTTASSLGDLVSLP